MGIDFSNIESPVSLTREYILSKIEDHNIFRYYYGPFELNKRYHSKLRQDRNPSISFRVNRSGKIKYHDFAKNHDFDCFDYVSELHGLGFKETLERIATDFGIIKGKRSGNVPKIISFDKAYKKETLIQFEIKEWTDSYLEYWDRREIYSEDLINDKHIFSAGKVWINKKPLYNYRNDLRFVYVVKDPKNFKNVRFKIYTPEGPKETKWFSNVPLTWPFGYDDLDYSADTLIITKSFKDMKGLRKIWPSVMATQNESESALPIWLLEKLKSKFKSIVIWFDADETGVENCKKFNKYGCGYINTPKELLPLNIKDPDELVVKYGLDVLRTFLKKEFIKKNLSIKYLK